MKPHHFIIVVDFWSSCFWNFRKFFYIFVREYALYDVLIHEATHPFTHVDRRRYNPQHLDKMKKIYTLIIALAMLVVMADIALAQSTTPVQKTRYVYLWDVTGSIKSCHKYEDMYKFLKNDIDSKTSLDGTQIVIIPFNDKVLDERFSYEVKDGVLTPTGKTECSLAELKSKGSKWISDHYSGRGETPGYTDITSALNLAKKYLDDKFNTIFILLTDGGQEYYEDGAYVNLSNWKKNKSDEALTEKVQKAKCRLQDAICALDAKIESAKQQNNTYNKLYYVVFVNDANDPRNGLDGQEDLSFKRRLSSYTEFIDMNDGTVKLHFCPITAVLSNEKISVRNDKFSFRFKTTAHIDLEGIDVEVNVKGENKTIQNTTVKINKDNECIVKSPCSEGVYTCTVSCADGEMQIGNDRYIYWINSTQQYKLVVTREFSPVLTVRLVK